MIPIVLSAELKRQIESEGARAYPNECCGVMLGCDTATQRIVERLMPVANVFDETERYHRFSISPKQLMDAERIASEEGRLVLGFYHSHPDHPARPSEYDRSHAWPFYSYVIVSIEDRRPGSMTSWVLVETTEQFQQQEVIA